MVRRSLLLLLLASTSCARPPRDPAREGALPPSAAAREPGPGRVEDSGEAPPFSFRLSDGADLSGALGSRTPPPPSPTPAELPAAEVEALLVRLPSLPPLPEDSPRDAPELALREASLPPPRAGKTLPLVFAAGGPPDALAPRAGPRRALEVSRFAPEGAVPIAAQLSVTFSEPMVAVTSQDAAARVRPVKLSPEPPGEWRWIGTQTLLFVPKDRFAMATVHRVEVPAGTESALGSRLAEARSWTFTTPPPSVVSFSPQGRSVTRAPVMVARFDQRIDPARVLAKTAVSAAGDAVPTELVPQEVLDTPELHGLLAGAEPGRWVAFRPVAPLAAGAEVAVSFGPGIPSAEGTLETEERQVFTFETHGPMKLVGHRCGWGEGCPPYSPLYLQLSNPIDAEAFREDLIRVTPELADAEVSVHGNVLMIRGATRGDGEYRVAVSPRLRDLHGQELGAEAEVTFQITPAHPSLSSPGGNLVILDPEARPSLSVYSINYPKLEVRIYAVTPEQFFTFTEVDFQPDRPMPGRLVEESRRDVAGGTNELVETRIDLARHLSGGHGHLAVEVRPPESPPAERQRGRPPVIRRWVQATKLGLDALAGADELLVFVTDLATGRPREGVEVTLSTTRTEASSAEDGLVSFQLPPPPVGPRGEPDPGGPGMIIARRGEDVAFLPEVTWDYRGRTAWTARPARSELRAHVFDDRGMYRPGESARVKGYLRRVGLGEGGDVELADVEGSRLTWSLTDSRGNQVSKGTASVGTLGTFELEIPFPKTMNLGTANLSVELTSRGRVERLHHGLRVEELRRPELEVTLGVAGVPAPGSPPPTDHFGGSTLVATARAEYYAGGGLSGAEITWRVSSSAATFTPPGRETFTFGAWTPWWRVTSYGDDDDWPSGQGTEAQVLRGTTGPDGAHHLAVELGRAVRARNVHLVATVIDLNHQALSASTDVLVHPAELYPGIRAARSFLAEGEVLEPEVIAVGLDGRAVAGVTIDLAFARIERRQRAGRWVEELFDERDCRLTSGPGPVSCAITPARGGRHRIRARLTDAHGRANESELFVWVSGGDAPPDRELREEVVELIPDKREHQAGETAELLVRAPFSPAEGLLTLRRGGIVSHERFSMEEATHVLRVPLRAEWAPGIELSVELTGSAPRVEGGPGPSPASLPPRPAYASAAIHLRIPPRDRTLDVVARPGVEALAPGGSTEVQVAVRDHLGRAVAGAEVTVVVADEAILALSSHRIPDPISTFYRGQDGGVRGYRSRAHLLLARPGDLGDDAIPPPPPPPGQTLSGTARSMKRKNGEKDFGSSVLGGEEGGAPPIAVRSDFTPLALFAPRLVTGADGRASVKLELPDSLTRYRITAVAVAGARSFGKGESSITARLPLMVRPSPPRFLAFGDELELPVLVQNQTAAPVDAAVAVRAAGVALTSGAGRRVRVPANDRVLVRFPARVLRPGTARFELVAAAVGGAGGAAGAADAATVSLPIWSPATTEAFATYGEVDRGVVFQPIALPPSATRTFGGLDVAVASTQVQALTDAVVHLVSYPFECSEQLATRILAITSLRDVLNAFEAEGLPPPRQLLDAVDRDLEKLRGMQNGDGGFPFWRRGAESWPFNSIHVAHALARAKEKRLHVPEELLSTTHGYLTNIERSYPADHGPEVRRVLTAYALYVRWLLDDRDTKRARELIAESGGVEKVPLEAIGWLYPVLAGDEASKREVSAIRRLLANRASETAGAAHFTTRYEDGGHLLLHSDRRVDALVLYALIADQPKSDLIPKLVRGLLAHRTGGRWSSTQDNVWALLALDRYFATYEKEPPSFTARLWLGARYAGEQQFRGRTTETRELSVPMAELAASIAPGGAERLVLQKEGTGRLYYRIGLRYAPESLTLAPADRGFTVERRYEAIDVPEDVAREDGGRWRIRAGARVRVRVTMVVPSRRYHVALVDPLPAGLEVLNPALATTEPLPADRTPGARRGGGWWWGPWYEHQNLRDERAEAFASLLPAGVYEYVYEARATTRGTFVVSPAKAEEMYSPETFGRSATDRVVVD